MIEHQTAIDDNVTERYLLGELNEEQANDFEEHYFDCRVCSEAVQIGATFMDSAKVVVLDGDKKRKKNWMAWFPHAVAAMLAVIVGYQAIGPIRTVQVEEPPAKRMEFVRLVGGERAVASETVVTLHRSKETALSFDIVSESQFPNYRWEFRNTSGAAKAAETLSAEVARDPIFVQLSSALPAGNYVLVVEGVRGDGNRTEITRFPFIVKRVE